MVDILKITHKAERDSVSINHPNEYFDLTRTQATKPEGKENVDLKMVFFLLQRDLKRDLKKFSVTGSK